MVVYGGRISQRTSSMEKYPCEGTTVLLINTTVILISLQDPKDVGQKKKDCRKEKYKELFGGCPRKLMEVFPILDNVGSHHETLVTVVY